MIDVTLRGEFHDSCIDPASNGEASYADPNGEIDAAVKAKLDNYQHDYSERNFLFLPAVMTTSGRISGDFLRLLYILDHRQSSNFFTRMGRGAAARRLPRGASRGHSREHSCRTAARRRPRLPLGAAASSSPRGQSSPDGCTGGPAEGAEQRRWVGGVEASDPETGRARRARGRVGGAGEGAWRRVSAARRRRNGRVAPYAAARLHLFL